MYIPLYNVSERQYLIKIAVKKMCFFTVSLPLFAFFICVFLTMYKDFEHANNTHCKVPNVFPSISASIGNYEPQRTMWRTAIYIHAPFRFFIIFLRWQYFKSVIIEDYEFIITIAIILNFIENMALLGLSHWTSTLYYPYHEKCFKTFVGCSTFYMLIVCIMLSKYRRRPKVTEKEMKSVKLKWRALIINVGSFAVAAYCFLRHNRSCEPYVYSIFGLAEYVVVLSNIAFHMTTVYDLPRKFMYITSRGVFVE